MNMQIHESIPPRTAMEVFELLPEGTLCQVIENQLYMSPAPTFPHFLILKYIYRAMDSFVEKHALGIVAFAPVDVFIDEQNVFQTDIFFIASEHKNIISDKGIIGAPDIAIEILSEGTARHDLGKKKDVYERNGVKEYFVINGKNREVQAFYLDDRKYREVKLGMNKIKSELLKHTFRF